MSRRRRPAPRRPARRPRRRPRVLRARRELSRRARRAPRRAGAPPVTCRHEAGAANMADAYGKLTGRPGICLVTRGPGATHAIDRRPHRVPGLDADDPARRPGRARAGASARRSRRSTTAACSGRSRSGSRRSTTPPASPSTSSRAFTTAMSGPAGPGRARAAGGHAAHASRRADAPPYRAVRPHPAPSRSSALRELLAARERPLALLGGGGWTPQARGRHARVRSRRATLPVGAAFRRQDLSTTTRRATSATSASASTRRSPRACREADLLLVVGARLGEMTTSRLHAARVADAARRRSSTSTPAPEELGRVYRPALPILAGIGAVRGRRRARCAVEPPLARVDRRGARRLRGVAAARADARRRSISASASRTCASALPGRDRHQRRRQLLRLGAPLLALARLPAPSSRRRAARWATACPRRSPRRPCSPSGR